MVAPTARQPPPPQQQPHQQPPPSSSTALAAHPHEHDGDERPSHPPPSAAGPPTTPPPSSTERHLNQALGSLPHDSDAEAVLALVAKEVAFFNAVNCATALTRLSRAAFRARWPGRRVAGDRRFAALLAQTGRRLGESGPAQQNQYMSAFVST